MKIKTLIEATTGFNSKYTCFWKKGEDILPITDFEFDSENAILYLKSLHSHAIQFRELNVILNGLNSQTKILFKTKSGQTFPLFGFTIVEHSQLYFS